MPAVLDDGRIGFGHRETGGRIDDLAFVGDRKLGLGSSHGSSASSASAAPGAVPPSRDRDTVVRSRPAVAASWRRSGL